MKLLSFLLASLLLGSAAAADTYLIIDPVVNKVAKPVNPIVNKALACVCPEAVAIPAYQDRIALFAPGGNDVLYGGDGNDRLLAVGGGGNDLLLGGTGNDRLVTAALEAAGGHPIHLLARKCSGPEYAILIVLRVDGGQPGISLQDAIKQAEEEIEGGKPVGMLEDVCIDDNVIILAVSEPSYAELCKVK